MSGRKHGLFHDSDPLKQLLTKSDNIAYIPSSSPCSCFSPNIAKTWNYHHVSTHSALIHHVQPAPWPPEDKGLVYLGTGIIAVWWSICAGEDGQAGWVIRQPKLISSTHPHRKPHHLILGLLEGKDDVLSSRSVLAISKANFQDDFPFCRWGGWLSASVWSYSLSWNKDPKPYVYGGNHKSKAKE